MTMTFEQVQGGWAPALRRDLREALRLADFQAVGIVANCMEETQDFTIFHELGQPPEAGGIGASQWTGTRRKAFEAWAASHGKAVTSYAANLGYIVAEATGSERQALVALKATKNAHEATVVWCNTYERPGTPRLDVRLKWADRLEAETTLPAQATSLLQDIATALKFGGPIMPAKLTTLIAAAIQAIVAIFAFLNATGLVHIDQSLISALLGVGMSASAAHKTITPTS
jgi:hypothetical protein